jgi:hypothetical protein
VLPRLGALALLVLASSTTTVDPPRIVPWHEIGNIGLGMSHARVERMYGRAINGNPPRETIDWQYRGRGVITVDYDANGHVEDLSTTSPSYSTRSGIHVGMRIPLGPCHRVAGRCVHRWHGFTFDDSGGKQFREWFRIARFGRGPIRVNVQLGLGPNGAVSQIWLSQYLHCSWADIVATSCKKPAPLPVPPPPTGLRWCRAPNGPGAFLAASPEVSCHTAHDVEAGVFSERCWNRTRCETGGFTCIAIWDGRTDRPFSFTHHADCRDADGDGRVEMDEG